MTKNLVSSLRARAFCPSSSTLPPADLAPVTPTAAIFGHHQNVFRVALDAHAFAPSRSLVNLGLAC